MDHDYSNEPFSSANDERNMELSGEWEEKAKVLVKEIPEKR